MPERDLKNGLVPYEWGEAADRLRARLRAIVDEALPPGWLGPFTHDPDDLEISNRFCKLLAAEGLLIRSWPHEFGGAGASIWENTVVREEMWAHFEPRGAQYYGPNWIGPSIMRFGTDEQKRRHLPPIAAGEVIWCQGFSEPDAGSDLAALRTRAVPDGDGFRITGAKIWTSWALWADWCYLLARVVDQEDASSPDKHAGITVFLIPMDREGIEVRGIDGIPGPHHLNEVVLDGVWAARSEVLGPVGKGWEVIRDALAHERIGIARYARGDRLLAMAEGEGGLAARITDLPPGLRARWTEAKVRNRTARLMNYRAVLAQQAGGANDFEVSAARLVVTRADQFVADVLSDALGDRFFEDRYVEDAPLDGGGEFFWRYSQAATIASGTTEMLQLLLSRALFNGERLGTADALVDVRRSADGVVRELGGIELARAAVREPRRRAPIRAAIDALVEGLDPRADLDAALAAAEICRAAGSVVLPFPIAPQLLARQPGVPLAMASERGHRVEHGDLFAAWEVVDTAGVVRRARPRGRPMGTRTGPFVVDLDVGEPAESVPSVYVALLHVLSVWYVLGALERALDLAVDHAQGRVQFGKPIATFQGVAFPLADASALLQGLRELALHATWRAFAAPESSIVDALALRWSALDAARHVLRIAHQVHGAIGLCDEHDLAIITLGLQAPLRLPTGPDETLALLEDAIARHGWASLYSSPEPTRA